MAVVRRDRAEYFQFAKLMTRIDFISPDPSAGGIGDYTETLADSLPADVEWRILTLEDPIDCVRVLWSVLRNPPSLVHLQHEYRYFGVASAFSFVFFPVLYVLTRIRGSPVVITLHEIWTPDMVSKPPQTVKRLYVTAVNRVIRAAADHILFLSQHSREMFFDRDVPDNTSVFRHGTPVESVNDGNQSDAKREYGYQETDVVVAHVGYVTKRKGTDSFIEAARYREEYEFLVAGTAKDPSDKRFLEDLIAEAPENVKFTEGMPEFRGELSEEAFQKAFIAADIIILPYRTIQQSGIFNWCMAHDVPTLARDIPYFRSIYDEEGCLLLFRDQEEMVTQIDRLVGGSDPTSEERKSFKRRYSFKEMANEHLKLYQGLADSLDK